MADSLSTPTLVLIALIAVIPVLAVYVWTALALSAVFGKIGQEPWRAWVPIVNQVTLVMFGGMSGWWFLLILIPGVGALAFWVITIVAVHRINRGFGLGGGMTALAALLFPVWASVVGFGEPRWRGADAASAAAPGYARSEHARTLDPALGILPATGEVSVPPRPPLPAPAYAPPPLPPRSPAMVPAPEYAGSAGGRPPALPTTPAAAAARPAAPEPAVTAAPAAPAEPAAAPAAAAGAPQAAARSTAPSAWAPPPPAPPASTAPVPTHAGAGFVPPTADAGAQPSSGPVPWTPGPDAAVRSAPANEGFDARWASGLDEVSAISQPPQGAPVAARPVATGLPALADDGAAGPERGRTGEAAPAVPAPPVLAEPAPPVPLRTAPVDIDPSFPAVTRAPAGPPRAASALDPEFPLDTADEVSAVAGAPVAGSPRSALSAVAGADAASADEDFPDQTVVARRRRVMWTLQPASGAPIDLTADVVILGRQPASDPAHRNAQLVAIADDTRTVSKTHARLELRGDRWIVTDLGSTNGVMLPTLMGTEIEAEPGAELAPGERFLLGDAAFRLVRVEG